MTIDQSKTIFSTRYNFLKILVNDNTTISVATGTATYLLYTHGLGYIPRARVFYEPVSGQLWPMTNEQFLKLDGGTGTQLDVTGTYHLTTVGLYVDLTSSSGSTQDIPFYYRIYVDE